MHLIIYGPEGSGKGTQAKLLSKKLGLPIFTSGNLVREEAQNDQSDIGKLCKIALTTGSYVSNEVMFILWGKRLKTKKAINGFILDGFPRNVAQANFLFEKIKEYDFQIDKVIYLSLSDKEAHRRLLKRKRKLFAGSSISHDTKERINHRLKIYRREEARLLEFFKKKNILLKVDGFATVANVHRQIMNTLKTPQ